LWGCGLRNTRAKPKTQHLEYFCLHTVEESETQRHPLRQLLRCDATPACIALSDTRSMRQSPFVFAAHTALFAVLGLAATLAAATALGRAARAENEAEAEAESQLEGLRRTLAAHAQEASRLDHAFRTPIGAAAAALELLETSGDDPELQAQARQVIARQLSRMTALTESLREAAQRLGDKP
jgi:signal transduction histidine kinase